MAIPSFLISLNYSDTDENTGPQGFAVMGQVRFSETVPVRLQCKVTPTGTAIAMDCQHDHRIHQYIKYQNSCFVYNEMGTKISSSTCLLKE